MLIFNLFKKHDKYYLSKVKFKKYRIYLIKSLFSHKSIIIIYVITK